MIKIRTEGKINSHFGVRDYYKYYKKNVENPVEYSKYVKVISELNELVIDDILNKSQDYILPVLGLTLTIRKDERKPQIKNGKLYNNRPPDWQKTNALWDIDPEAKAKKVLVRHINSHTSGFVYRIFCHKFNSSLKNKYFYKFKPSRNFQRSLSQRINDPDKDRFDCYLLHKNK
jgi:hypothetical protein